MTTTINANTSAGLVYSADTSGIVKLQSNGVATNALAWVNFTGSTAVIRASYNVTSVTRTASGQFTINFTNAMADANYVFSGACSTQTSGYLSTVSLPIIGGTAPSTSSLAIITLHASGGGTYFDPPYVFVSVFGN